MQKFSSNSPTSFDNTAINCSLLGGRILSFDRFLKGLPNFLFIALMMVVSEQAVQSQTNKQESRKEVTRGSWQIRSNGFSKEN